MAKQILIIGTDWCGSTLLSKLLWLVPGVVAPGEVHALLRGARGCDLCKQSCPILGKKSPTMQYKGLTATNLYSRVERAFSPSRAIVFSDKATAVYARTVPANRPAAIGLVLFRPPWAHVASEHKRRRRNQLDAFEHWLRRYTAALRFARVQKKVVVDFDALVADPAKALPVIVRALGLPRPASVPADLQTIKWHHVGGSRTGRKTTSVDTTLSSVDRIPTPKACLRVYSRLLRESVI